MLGGMGSHWFGERRIFVQIRGGVLECHPVLHASFPEIHGGAQLLGRKGFGPDLCNRPGVSPPPGCTLKLFSRELGGEGLGLPCLAPRVEGTHGPQVLASVVLVLALAFFCP